MNENKPISTASNPFSIAFGIPPARLVSRPEQVGEILSDFLNPVSSSHVFMISGVRGAGKTVLLTSVAEELQREDGWIVVDLNPNRDMLLGLAGKLYDLKETHRLFLDARIDLSLFGIGVSIKKAEPIADIETAISRMIRLLGEHGKKLLITVDEVTNNKFVRVFAGTFQSLLRERMPVYLLMTGLYDNINNLQNEKSLTFLYRAPKIMLGPLNLYAIKTIYQDTFDISEEMAVRMAKLTGGYPFAFQVLGYLCWRAGGMELTKQEMDRQVLLEYDHYLEDYSYDKIWSELNAPDQRIVTEMMHQNCPTTISVRTALEMSPQLFHRYRKRLVLKGIIREEGDRRLYYVLPRFREYLERRELMYD